MEGSWNDCDEGYGATFAGLSSWTFDRKQQLIAELEFTRYTYSEDQREIEEEDIQKHGDTCRSHGHAQNLYS